MNTKALRQKILDLAIHGKLVAQDPNDEPASVLLERIRDEKERLIKEGKIKRPKKTKATSDKPHYPYELPEGWAWTTIGSVCNFENGYAFSSNDYKTNGIPLVRISNIADNRINLDVCVFIQKNVDDRFIVKKGDLLIALSGATTGKMGVYSEDKVAYLNQRVGNLHLVDSTVLCPEYRDFFMYSKTNTILELAYGGAQPNISGTVISSFLLPLPPYAEQLRIIKETNRLLSFIDTIEEGNVNLQNFIRRAKFKILDLAIHGKLVPQDPNDEPASELLKRINPNAKITSDNGHYQKLPEGWCECKLSDVCVFDNGYAFSSDNYNDCGIPLIRISNITNTGSIDLSSCVFIQDVPSNKFIVKSGDLLIAMSGATTGKMGVYLYEEDALLNQRVGNLKCTDAMLQQYRNYYMFAKSDYILKIAYGGAQPNISAKAILDIDVMLPPLKEQHRIVAKIEEIFAQLDAIEASL